jgi:hypothetical protein
MLARAVALLVMICISTYAEAQKLPRFKDYYVGVFGSPMGLLDQSYVRPLAEQELLQAAAWQPVNFGGRYQLVEWSCGAHCVTGSIIDATNGQLWSLPLVDAFGMDSASGFRHLNFRPDSTLLIISGSIRGGAEKGRHYYIFDKGYMAELLFVPWRPTEQLFSRTLNP